MRIFFLGGGIVLARVFGKKHRHSIDVFLFLAFFDGFLYKFLSSNEYFFMVFDHIYGLAGFLLVFQPSEDGRFSSPRCFSHQLRWFLPSFPGGFPVVDGVVVCSCSFCCSSFFGGLSKSFFSSKWFCCGLWKLKWYGSASVW